MVAHRDAADRRSAPTKISTSRLSAWSIALVTRLRTIRSTRRMSASTTQGARGRARTTRVSRWAASAEVMSTTRRATSTRSTSSVSSMAAPASNRLISSRSASSASKRSSSFCSSSAARAVDRVEERPRVVHHVAGHPHRGDRGAQLVGDVGDEAPLQPAELLQLADLPLQVGGHLVERRGQAGEVVLAVDAQRSCELAGGEALGDPSGHPDRGHHLAGHQPGEAGHEQQQRHAGDEHRPRDEGERLLLLGQREEVVERVGVVVGGEPDLAADHDAGPLGQTRIGAGRADVGVGPGRRARGSRSAPPGVSGTLARSRPSVNFAPPSARRTPSLTGGDSTTAKPRRRPARLDRLDEGLLLRRLVDVEPGRGGQRRAGGLGLALGLLHDGVDPVVEQAVTGLLDQEPAHDADDRRGEQHRADHDPRLHRAPPEGGPVPQHRWEPVAHAHPWTPRTCRPCSRRRGRSPRPRGSPGRARPWSAGAGRGR